jgi:type VI secretion system secreted protein VgrG
MERLATIITPLPEGKMLFHKLDAHESLGRRFQYEVDLLSDDGDIDYGQLLGKTMTIVLNASDKTVRHFNGYVVLFGLTGKRGRYFVYQASLRPWTWFLTQTSDCRIFQDKNAFDIAKLVFDDHAMAKVQAGALRKPRQREYCVQYRETDADFIDRLLEDEGVYTYYTHSADSHTLVLADSPEAHHPFADFDKLAYLPVTDPLAPPVQAITEWLSTDELRSGLYTTDDYDFQRSQVDLQTAGERVHHTALPSYETYDAPGTYVQRDDGTTLAFIRAEEVQSRCRQFRGSTSARGLAVGHTFTIGGLPRAAENATYLVESTDIVIVQADYEGLGGSEGSSFECTFSVTPVEDLPWRPERTTRRPIVQGPQTAEVVGPKDDEIHTDRFGRVKVLFHWDRERRRIGKPEDSSCWVRVSQAWAGKNYGFIAIPRIGQEVIVDFLEGDPDRPIITGRVHNDQQMPPWPLPEHMTRTGIVTRSTREGDATKANELRFEDKKGHEQVYLHAERNLDTSVEANETRDVGGDRTTHIHGNDRLTVHKERHEVVNGEYRTLFVEGLSNRTIRSGEVESIDYGLKTTIRGGHELTVENGGQKIEVKDGISETVQGKVTQDIWGGGYTQTITGGSHTETVSGGSADYTASEGFSFTTPLTHVINAGTSVTVNTPQLNLLGGAKISAVTSESSLFTPLKFEYTGFVNEAKAIATAATGLNLETKGVELAGIMSKGEKVGYSKSEWAMNEIAGILEMRTLATWIKKGGLSLGRHVMTILN